MTDPMSGFPETIHFDRCLVASCRSLGFIATVTSRSEDGAALEVCVGGEDREYAIYSVQGKALTYSREANKREIVAGFRDHLKRV